ncbi:hypothetical protein O6H91_16G053000 [Diphasiastrum complanatum]|uniref:Uncharacterized protein n=1 Tax=Diphasiastrum complanatum TaxID=34168 RepID=A0ACC2BCH4_DIPCM|nr:hypothetical protein O6H91_16G053000 [Diphasiastrum complanatum]
MVASSPFPSCFGEYAMQVAEMSSGNRTTHNLIACIYCTKLCSCYHVITISWCKNQTGQGFSVAVDNPSAAASPSLPKVGLKPWVSWKKQGKKAMEVDGKRVQIFWDMTAAKYSSGGPEPQESFYLAIVFHGQILMLLGDKKKEAYDATQAKPLLKEPILLSRREHIFGKKYYNTKAQFCESGRSHDIVIECHSGGAREPRLCVRVDRRIVVHVKRLMWKFRGNQTILVDGLEVELFWDVHNWLFNPDLGNAVFMFQTYFPSSHLKSCNYGEQESFPVQVFKGRDFEKLSGFSLLLHAWRIE